MTLIWDFIGLLALYPLMAFVVGLSLSRRRVHRAAPTDVVILGAHPDDCVISAGEYAIESLGLGKSVRVVFLTSGSSREDQTRAEVRRLETLDAWGSVGVEEQDVLFLGLPQAERITGPGRITPDEQAWAVDRITEVLSAAPPDASVFLPAEGESHCDHRTLRTTAYEALGRIDRTDLCVYECPEYNHSYSLFSSPVRTIFAIGRSIPILSKLVPRKDGLGRADTVFGGPAWRLPACADRLEMKRAMLRRFVSEDGELLVRYFGYPDRFRPIPHERWGVDGASWKYARVRERRLAWSVVVLWVVLWVSIVIEAMSGVHGVLAMDEIPNRVGVAAFALLGIVIGGYGARGKHQLEKRITILMLCAGVCAGILL